MVGRPLEPSPFYMGLVEGDFIEGREAVGALVPMVILPTEEAVIKDPIVLFANP